MKSLYEFITENYGFNNDTSEIKKIGENQYGKE